MRLLEYHVTQKWRHWQFLLSSADSNNKTQWNNFCVKSREAALVDFTFIFQPVLNYRKFEQKNGDRYLDFILSRLDKQKVESRN